MFSVQSWPNLVRLQYPWILQSDKVWPRLDWKLLSLSSETSVPSLCQKVRPNFGRIFWNLHLFSFLKPWVTYLYRLCIKVKNTKGIFFEKYDEGSIALHWHNENINVNPGLGGGTCPSTPLVPRCLTRNCLIPFWFVQTKIPLLLNYLKFECKVPCLNVDRSSSNYR